MAETEDAAADDGNRHEGADHQTKDVTPEAASGKRKANHDGRNPKTPQQRPPPKRRKKAKVLFGGTLNNMPRSMQ